MLRHKSLSSDHDHVFGYPFMVHEMNQESMESTLCNHWKATHSNWCHCPGHECSMDTCNIQQVIGGVWIKGGQTHICIRSMCQDHPKWANKGTLKRQIRNLYMCCSTGQSHWCDEQCSCTSVDHLDGGYICRISGIRYDSIKSDTWFTGHRVTATHQENKDPLKLVRNTDFKVNQESSDTIREQQHLYISKKQVMAILFSADRLYMEQRKYVDMKHEAEKVVFKYVKTCEKKQQSVVFTHVVQLYINQMNRRHIFRNLLPQKRTIDDVVSHYSSLTCRFWRLLTQKIPLGVQTPALFPIKIFIVSILYIMKGGLCLGGVQVIDKDGYLASVLPEANTLDSYNINKPAFTACKNNILKAYREASEGYKMNPNQLLI